MKKRGVTLLEIVIVLAISSSMLVILDSVFISYLKSFQSNVLFSQGFNYLNEAIALIEKEVNQGAKEVKAEGNIIKITYCDEITVNHIKLINSNLYILYGTQYVNPADSPSKNLIIDDVKEFEVKKVARILYIKIVWYNGQVIERCLAIQNAN